MPPKVGDVSQLYRRHAAIFIAQRDTSLIERAWLQRFVSLLPANAHVLDLGCGFGAPMGAYLIQEGCQLTGLDSAPELIDAARARFPGAHWKVGDMRHVSLDARFDGILAWHSFFHLSMQDQRRMFGVFADHMDAGGILMLTTGASAGEQLGKLGGEDLYHASLAAKEYRDLFEHHDFNLLDHIENDPDCGGATVWLAQKR